MPTLNEWVTDNLRADEPVVGGDSPTSGSEVPDVGGVLDTITGPFAGAAGPVGRALGEIGDRAAGDAGALDGLRNLLQDGAQSAGETTGRSIGAVLRGLASTPAGLALVVLAAVLALGQLLDINVGDAGS